MLNFLILKKAFKNQWNNGEKMMVLEIFSSNPQLKPTLRQSSPFQSRRHSSVSDRAWMQIPVFINTVIHTTKDQKNEWIDDLKYLFGRNSQMQNAVGVFIFKNGRLGEMGEKTHLKTLKKSISNQSKNSGEKSLNTVNLITEKLPLSNRFFL